LLTAASVNAGRLRERPRLVGRESDWHGQEGELSLGSLLGAFILTFTVILAVTLGILSAYGVVIGILHSFASRPRPIGDSPVLVPSHARAAHAGGD
jgi:hypothetical protein